MMEEVLHQTEERMSKALEALKRDLASLRTGRASPALVENLRVEYYGVPTPLKEIASIGVPEARLLLIQPWDRGALPPIEKALLKSDLGLTPSNDGHVIRLPIPPLTEERRRELVKVVWRRVEEGKVALRNVRRDVAEELKTRERNRELSEDDRKRATAQLQKLLDGFIAEVDRLGQVKEAEILEG